MVPVWQHVTVIVVLLSIQVAQSVYLLRRNKELFDALEMRDLLLGETESTTEAQTYKDISPAVAAYSAARMLNHAAPFLKLDKFGQINRIKNK